MQTGVEDCDDGNNVNGDGCSSNCLIEADDLPPPPPPTTPPPLIPSSCNANQVPVRLKLQTDFWAGEENSFYLYEWYGSEMGTSIWKKEVGDLEFDFAIQKWQACLDLSNCYGFEFLDNWGDGLFSFHGLKLYLEDELKLEITRGEARLGMLGMSNWEPVE
jgi:cysteine-rich repeat protein